jgi:hypothetical protein
VAIIITKTETKTTYFPQKISGIPPATNNDREGKKRFFSEISDNPVAKNKDTPIIPALYLTGLRN